MGCLMYLPDGHPWGWAHLWRSPAGGMTQRFLGSVALASSLREIAITQAIRRAFPFRDYECNRLFTTPIETHRRGLCHLRQRDSGSCCFLRWDSSLLYPPPWPNGGKRLPVPRAVFIARRESMRETTSSARFSCPATFGFGMAHPGGGIAKVVWVAREVTPMGGRSGICLLYTSPSPRD